MEQLKEVGASHVASPAALTAGPSRFGTLPSASRGSPGVHVSLALVAVRTVISDSWGPNLQAGNVETRYRLPKS